MNATQHFAHWRGIRCGLFEALDLLADDQLAFTPREGLWPLGTVAVHIAEAEEGWFRYVVTRELDDWPDFVPEEYATIPSVKALLAEVHDRTWAYLEAVDETDLDRIIDAPWGAQFSLRWVVWHVLEHEIGHHGEIFLMLGLMGMEAPDV